MKKRRSTEQIVGLLRHADVDLGKGANVPDVCRRLGISLGAFWARSVVLHAVLGQHRVFRPKTSTPDRDRTCDLRFRKPSLYPLSYGGALLEVSVSHPTGEASETPVPDESRYAAAPVACLL